MKTTKFFFMAALALTFVACSNDDNEIQQPAQQGPMKFTATLAAPNSGATNRTTATAGTGDDAGKFLVTWEVDDEIALIYEVSSTRYLDKAKVTAVDASGNATISGTLSTFVTSGTAVNLVYPYDVVQSADEDLGTGKAYRPDMYYFNGQTGAAPTDATNGLPKYDWRDGSGTFSVSGTSVTLSGNVTMGFNTAIWKLNLTSGGSPLLSNSVTLICGMPIFRATFPDDVSEFYLYVPIPIYNNMKSMGTPPLEIVATSGVNDYSYSHSAVTLTGGKIYNSNVTLAQLYFFDVNGGGHGSYISYNAGETWTQAIANHSDNAGWLIDGGCVKFSDGFDTFRLQDNHDTDISPTDPIDDTVTYKWVQE